MSATFEERPRAIIDVRCDYVQVPAWHLDWISEHAEKLARQAFLAAAQDDAEPQMIGPRDFEEAGIAIVGDVIDALKQIEDALTTKQAALFGAEFFLRRLYELLSTCGRGGRA